MKLFKHLVNHYNTLKLKGGTNFKDDGFLFSVENCDLLSYIVIYRIIQSH